MHGNRVRLRQQLEKERQELEKRAEEEERRRQRNAIVSQPSNSMNIPQKPQPPQVTIEVPKNVLEVRSSLQNPTSFHVESVRQNQLHQYLSSQTLSSPITTHSAPASNNVFGNGANSNGSGPGAQRSSYKKDPMLSEVSGDYNHSPIHQNTTGNSSSTTGLHNLSAANTTGPEQHYLQHPAGTPAGVSVKSESPIMMSTDQPLSQNEQAIINDIMGIEDKLDGFGPLPYFDTSMVMPQTLPVTTNLFDVFATGNASSHQMFVPQISSSCPPEVKEDKMREVCSFNMNPNASIDIKHFEKERIKKNNHNMIERRRRFNINDRIKELGHLLPSSDSESRQNKGTILKASVDYIRKLQRDVERLKIQDARQRQLEETNIQMRLRIQELELTARAHGIPTPSLNPETKQLAEAADKVLGQTTPRARSPVSSTTTTPLSPHLFGADEYMLRASPGIDLSRLNIKTEPLTEEEDDLTVSVHPLSSPHNDPLISTMDSNLLSTLSTTNNPHLTSTDPLADVDPSMSLETAIFSSTASFLTSSSISMANSTIFGET